MSLIPAEHLDGRSECGVNHMKAWIHPASYQRLGLLLVGWGIFLARFGPLGTHRAWFEGLLLTMPIPLGPQCPI